MKKKICILGLCSLMLCGCGKIPKLSNGDEAVITFKDGQKISANDFYEEIKNNYGLQILLNMIDKHIYETEFSDHKEEALKEAEAQIKAVKANYEDEEKFLQALEYYGYKDEEAYREYVYVNSLQSIGIETYVKDNLTEKELKDYYEKSVYPNMTISHILVTSKATSSSSADEKTKAETEAKDTVKKIIEELNKAKKENKDLNETFSNLAKEYSEDSANKDKGGLLGEINIGSLGSQYDELVKAAAKLKDGEYSTEVITTEIGYHVILKTKTGEKASYEDSLDSMKEAIANEKLTKDATLITDAIQHYRKKYEMDIIDSEMESQYSKYMNNMINSYKSQNSSK